MDPDIDSLGLAAAALATACASLTDRAGLTTRIAHRPARMLRAAAVRQLGDRPRLSCSRAMPEGGV